MATPPPAAVRAVLRLLLVVTLVNYVAQIPYYLVLYYLPHGTAPSARSVALLGLTLAWFLLGYTALRARRGWGRPVLLGFLCVEALFYLRAFLSGAVAHQLDHPDVVVRAVFVIGYASGATAAAAAYLLIRYRGALLDPPPGG